MVTLKISQAITGTLMNYKSTFGKSTAWMSLAAGGSSIVSFFIFIVLSRLLNPEDIGLVAFALIFMELGKIIISSGFSQVIIQKREWDNDFASTCFYLNCGFAIIVALIVFFIVAPLAGIYFDEKAVPILQVFAVFFFFEGVKVVHEGKLKREFEFKVIALRTILASLIPGAIGIYFAIEGYGVWALVIQQSLHQMIITILTVIKAKWKPSLTFSKTFAKEILHFSSPLMGAQIMTNFSTKLFELLIALIIGPAALGFYRVAGRALYIIQDIVLKPFEHTALSLLARMDGKAKQADAVLRIIAVSSFLIMPIFWGIAAIAPLFIALAFGEKWAPSGLLMMILAVGLTPLMIGIFVKAALMANKQSKRVMNLAIISFLINCCLGLASVTFGLEWAAIGYTVRAFVINGLSLFWLRSLLGIPLSIIPKLLLPSSAASLVMFIAILLLNPMITTHLSSIFTLVFLCLFGALVYTVIMFCIFKTSTHDALREALNVAPQKFKPYILSLKGFTKP
jgi:O-antigen/teichoic acid export membrane protein